MIVAGCSIWFLLLIIPRPPSGTSLALVPVGLSNAANGSPFS